MKPLVLAAVVATLLAPAAAFAHHHGGGIHLFGGHRSAPRPSYGGIMGARSHGGRIHDVRDEMIARPALTSGPRIH